MRKRSVFVSCVCIKKMALSALSCVAHFLESVPVTDEELLVLEEERCYSVHLAFVLATYVDMLVGVILDMRDVDSLFLSMDAMKTPCRVLIVCA